MIQRVSAPLSLRALSENSGTDRGIRIKSTRGRGGVVETVSVSNIVMRDIREEAITLNLFYSNLPASVKTRPLVQIGQNVSESAVVSNIRPTRISDTAEAE